jgi:hypothetical protein
VTSCWNSATAEADVAENTRLVLSRLQWQHKTLWSFANFGLLPLRWGRKISLLFPTPTTNNTKSLYEERLARLRIPLQYNWDVRSCGMFFICHVQGPELMPRIHCSRKAYCARPIYYSNCSHFCRLMSLRALHDARAPSSERWNYLWARNLTGNFN